MPSLKKPKDLKTFKASLKNGSSLQQAKKDAGFSHYTARMGSHNLAKPFKSAWLKHQAQYLALSKAHTAEDQEHVVRGRLLANVYEGKDEAVQSSKLLWQDKRVNQLVADNQIGVIVIQPPAAMMTELTQRLALPEAEPSVINNLAPETDS